MPAPCPATYGPQIKAPDQTPDHARPSTRATSVTPATASPMPLSMADSLLVYSVNNAGLKERPEKEATEEAVTKKGRRSCRKSSNFLHRFALFRLISILCYRCCQPHIN